MDEYDLVMQGPKGTIRLGPWSKSKADSLTYHQRLWERTTEGKATSKVEIHRKDRDGAERPPRARGKGG